MIHLSTISFSFPCFKLCMTVIIQPINLLCRDSFAQRYVWEILQCCWASWTVVGSFLLLDSILMCKHIRDSLSSLLERDFWVFPYDLCDTEYWKLWKFCLMAWYVASFCIAPCRLENNKLFSKGWVCGLYIFSLPIFLNPDSLSFFLFFR